MKNIAAAFFLVASIAMADVPKVAPVEAAELIADDKAILVDVREPNEWLETGVATPAKLLPKIDFDGPKTQWKAFLTGVGDRKIIVYCRSGRRSEAVAAELAKEGYKTLNVGGFAEWQKAGLPPARSKSSKRIRSSTRAEPQPQKATKWVRPKRTPFIPLSKFMRCR